jgi:phenylpropionate dioxygenase-like ring-hydroxylating dioxygenase large terminal subunit
MYLAHKNDLETNTVKPLEQYHKRISLVNNNGEHYTITNVCPHQASIICKTTSDQLSCCYHGWSWDLSGNPISNGSTNIENDIELPKRPVYESLGLLFDKPISLPELLPIGNANFELIESRIDIVKANSNIIMDVFLDVDHIDVVHRDVYDSIGIDEHAKVDFDYYSWGSVQLVKGEGYDSRLMNYNAIWIAVYPNIMIEWQPSAMFITVAIPVDDNTSRVFVYKYWDKNHSFEKFIINSKIWETAWAQDREQSEHIVRFTDRNLEKQKQHFRDYLRNEFPS